MPSDPFTVMVKYGKSTTTTIPSAFQFVENPIVLDHNPKKSFVWSVSKQEFVWFPFKRKVIKTGRSSFVVAVAVAACLFPSSH